MCDQANHDNCEIVDELHLEITNLEEENGYLLAQVIQLKSDCERYLWRLCK